MLLTFFFPYFLNKKLLLKPEGNAKYSQYCVILFMKVNLKEVKPESI